MKNKYSKEFKQEAIDIALHSDKPAYKIAQDLGINDKTFYSWIRQSMKKSESNNQSSAKPAKKDYQALERENRAMRKELELRKKEIDFLKKASAYFAKHQK